MQRKRKAEEGWIKRKKKGKERTMEVVDWRMALEEIDSVFLKCVAVLFYPIR